MVTQMWVKEKLCILDKSLFFLGQRVSAAQADLGIAQAAMDVV